jgi:uncharacterized membrane protein
MLDMFVGVMFVAFGIWTISYGTSHKEGNYSKSLIRAGVGFIVLGVLYIIFHISS